MAKIPSSLFDLTPEEIQQSNTFYGKVIKCLIAPYHTIKDIPLAENDTVFVFPERDLNIQQRKEIVGIMTKSQKPEICFVTSDVFIITDMIQCCTRILTPDGLIEETPTQTFSANAHNILISVLADERHVEKYKDGASRSRDIINNLITQIQKGEMTRKEYDNAKTLITSIGEEVISMKLGQMLRDVKITTKA